jgi:hypothetical protein
MMSPIFFNDRKRLAEFTQRHGLPSMFGLQEWAAAGACCPTDPNIIALFKHHSGRVDIGVRLAPARLSLAFQNRRARWYSDNCACNLPFDQRHLLCFHLLTLCFPRNVAMAFVGMTKSVGFQGCAAEQSDHWHRLLLRPRRVRCSSALPRGGAGQRLARLGCGVSGMSLRRVA